MPDDHSEVVPLLPIPNRTVKRFSADDSADSRVKVGHCQAIKARNAPSNDGAFFLASDLPVMLLSLVLACQVPSRSRFICQLGRHFAGRNFEERLDHVGFTLLDQRQEPLNCAAAFG